VKLNAKQLRKGKGGRGKDKVKKQEIYIVLDNVLDTYNIGSVFRLADAVAAKKVYLCGQTETPPNHRIKKASINTTEWVEWEYCETAVEAINKIKGIPSTMLREYSLSDPAQPESRSVKDIQVVAVEQSTKSVPYDKFDYTLPICLIVGNETTGVSKEVLDMADATVELPMFGVNISLNVMVCLGIVLYEVIERTSN